MVVNLLKSLYSPGFTGTRSAWVGREYSGNNIVRSQKDGSALRDRSTGVVGKYTLRNHTVSVGCHTVTRR